MSEEFLFVYGTLRKDSDSPMAHILEGCCEYMDKAHIRGTLYDLGRYPGVLIGPGQDDQVYGEVFRLIDREQALLALDEYEECAPHSPTPHLYHRRKFTAETESGPTVSCWVYVFNRSVEGCEYIPGGDYLTYLGERIRNG